jgi:hypothetical protein
MRRRDISFQRAELYRLCWRRIQRARGIKSVILALCYFSAAAGDALNSRQSDSYDERYSTWTKSIKKEIFGSH